MMHTHTKLVISRGAPLDQARRALILVHGRGADADDILGLAGELAVDGFALLAPQATGFTWYPYSFLAPVEQNEPSLSSALDVLGELVDDVLSAGIDARNLYFLGFSQGACLVSEFTARNARRYGGVFVLSGGVIGQRLNRANYRGDFQGAPVFFGCSDRDPHIPLERVNATAALFREMGAAVTEQIYPGMPHTVVREEIDEVNAILRS